MTDPPAMHFSQVQVGLFSTTATIDRSQSRHIGGRYESREAKSIDADRSVASPPVVVSTLPASGAAPLGTRCGPTRPEQSPGDSTSAEEFDQGHPSW
jgi:hypothetical protein